MALWEGGIDGQVVVCGGWMHAWWLGWKDRVDRLVKWKDRWDRMGGWTGCINEKMGEGMNGWTDVLT